MEACISAMQSNMQDTMVQQYDQLTSIVEGMPQEIKTLMLQHFNSAREVTTSDVEHIVTFHSNNVLVRLDSIITNRLLQYNCPPNNNAQTSSTAAAVTPTIATVAGKTWIWGGKLRVVPQDFQFPRCKIKQMWQLWHFGQHVLEIGPLKRLRHHRDDIQENQRYLLDKAIKVMDAIENMATREEILGEEENITAENCDNVFNQSYTSLLTNIFGSNLPNRYNDLFYTNNRVYKTLCKEASAGVAVVVDSVGAVE